MPPTGRKDELAALRRAVAGIERGGSAGAGRAHGSGDGRVMLGGGGLALDRALGGGLRRGTLIEVVAARPCDAGAACGFALALAVRFAAGPGTAPPGAGPEAGSSGAGSHAGPALTLLLSEMLNGQIAHYRTLGTWVEFGRGWNARAQRREAAALKLITL